MNILKQIIGFWTSQSVYSLDTTCIALYFYLVNVWNECRRQNPFKRRNDKIEGDLKITRNTLVKARQTLSECGLITFKTQNGKANVEYTLSNIDKVLEKLGETLLDFDKLDEKIEETLSNNDKVNEKSSSNIDKVEATLSETLSNFDNHNIKEKKKNNTNKENNKKKESKAYQNLTSSLVPTKNDVLDFFFSKSELKPSEAEKLAEDFYNYFSEKDWRNGKSLLFDWIKEASEWKGEPVEKRELTTRFVAPTVEDVKEYCEERNNNIDAQHFVDHYTANGWMRGKTKIKDWKACIRTWEKNNFNNKSKNSENGGVTESLARSVAEGIARGNYQG